MNDLISRQAAIDAIDKIFPADPMQNDYTQGITCGAALATEYIKQVPSAQPEQRWIPCSERLPEKEGAYLTCGERGYIYILEYAEGWNCFRNYDGIVERDCEIKDVIAWQPLPEPYKADVNNL